MKFLIQFFSIVSFVCSSVGFSSFANAQQTKAYIVYEPGFFSAPSLIVNEKATDFSNIAEAMKDNPEAYEHMRKFRKNAIIGGTILGIGFGGALAYLLVEASQDDSDIDGNVYFGLLLAGLIGGGVFVQKSQSHFYKAINSYNGVGGPKNSASNFDISLYPKKGGAGLALTYNF